MLFCSASDRDHCAILIPRLHDTAPILGLMFYTRRCGLANDLGGGHSWLMSHFKLLIELYTAS